MSAPRILIIRTDRIGDVVLSTPVVRALRTAYPDAYLAMMVRPAHRELIEGNPSLNAVILYDKDGKEKSWSATVRFAGDLRTHRFDTAVILHSTNRVILVSWLAGIRRRVGYARRLPWLLTHRLPYIKPEGNRHELEYNLALLRLIDVESQERTLHLPVTAAQEAKVSEFLRAQGANGRVPLVAIHPGASCSSKRWPAERFAAVADFLVERCGAKIIVVTGPEERAVGETVVSSMKHPALRAFGFFSLGELACLFKQSRVLISNDSGPVHIACAAGIPVVSIFGRWGGGLSPRRWGPTSADSVSLHRDIGCRPCLAHRCPIEFACLDAVSVEEVLAAAEHVGGLQRC